MLHNIYREYKANHFLSIKYESQYMDPYKRNKRVYGVALMKSLYIDKCLNGFMFISFTLRVISESICKFSVTSLVNKGYVYPVGQLHSTI